MDDKATTADGNSVAVYAYDYKSRRVSSAVAGVTRKYCYAGDQVIAEYDGSDTLKLQFYYGAGIDEPICMQKYGDDAGLYYYHYDSLGSVAALTDSTGEIVESYEYDIFGSPTIKDADGTVITQSAYENPYMFTGRRYDAETGNYYYRARYYSARLGRFLQTDPIGYTDGLNLYTYVHNNPIMNVDPLGLSAYSPSPGFLKEWETPGTDDSWSPSDAYLHFRRGSGRSVEFNSHSYFSQRVKSGIRGFLRERWIPDGISKNIKPIAESMSIDSALEIGTFGELSYYIYLDGGDLYLLGTIGSGGADEYSDVLFKANCFIERTCFEVRTKCKVQITIRDLYGFHHYPDEAKKGTNFWTIVHFFDDYEKTIPVKCK